jgi:hypothetical protein
MHDEICIGGNSVPPPGLRVERCQGSTFDSEMLCRLKGEKSILTTGMRKSITSCHTVSCYTQIVDHERPYSACVSPATFSQTQTKYMLSCAYSALGLRAVSRYVLQNWEWIRCFGHTSSLDPADSTQCSLIVFFS